MSAPGLERGLSILEYVESHSHAGFTEIMKELDLNRASLSRYLKVLLDQRYLAKVNGVYLPGERMGSFAVNREWDSQIYPLLSHISRETECSALWVEFIRGRMHFVERVIVDNGVSMRQPGEMGTNYLVNPAGYILLGFSPSDVRSILLQGAEYSPDQKTRIPSERQVQEWIDQVEKEGLFDDEGKIYSGVRRGAVPILRGKRLIGALVLGTVDQLVNDIKVKEKLLRAEKILSPTL
jgi:DNA-binding IclR family transcriptional regulator